MISTFSGNVTMLGSGANLIVVEWASAGGFGIGFWQYLRFGAPLALLTILFDI